MLDADCLPFLCSFLLQLWSGNPAAKLRTLTAEEQVVLKQSAAASSKVCWWCGGCDAHVVPRECPARLHSLLLA